MKRFILVLAVAAVMAAMMVVTVAPAFAAAPSSHPTPNANSNAFNNPSGRVSNCATDPTCGVTDVGQHQFQSFPPGQPPGPPA